MNSSLFHIITIYIFLVGNKIVERILKRNFHNFLLVQTSTNTTSIPSYKIRLRVSFGLLYRPYEINDDARIICCNYQTKKMLILIKNIGIGVIAVDIS